MIKDNIGVVVAWLIIVIFMAGVAFIMGVTMAYYLDQAEQKLPSVWGTMQETNLPINGDKLQVEPNYGTQKTINGFELQPALDITELEPLQEL